MCSELDLEIVNGTHLQSPSTLNRFTSFQGNGDTVIDLCVVSAALLQLGGTSTTNLLVFEVREHDARWSDHAAISLHLTLERMVLEDRDRDRSLPDNQRTSRLPVRLHPLSAADLALERLSLDYLAARDVLCRVYGRRTRLGSRQPSPGRFRTNCTTADTNIRDGCLRICMLVSFDLTAGIGCPA